jgi:malonate transporter and related proteins
VIALCSAIIGLYAIVFLLGRVAFRAQTSVSALIALEASAPAVPFMGPAILSDLFGTASAVPMGIAGLVINLTVVPLTILLLSLDATQSPIQRDNPVLCNSERPQSRYAAVASILVKTLKQPIVWAPVAAFAIVLVGLRTPPLLVHSLSLMGQAAGGVSLFASGIILASNKISASRLVLGLVALKNVVQPALILVTLRWLGCRNLIVSEAVLTTAIPMMPIVIMLATQYQVVQEEAASAVLLSSVSSVVTMGAFIALTS